MKKSGGLVIMLFGCIAAVLLTSCGLGSNSGPSLVSREPVELKRVAVAEADEMTLHYRFINVIYNCYTEKYVYSASWKTVYRCSFSDMVTTSVSADEYAVKYIEKPEEFTLICVMPGREDNCYLFCHNDETGAFVLEEYDESGNILWSREYTTEELGEVAWGYLNMYGEVSWDGDGFCLYSTGAMGTVYSFDGDGTFLGAHSGGVEYLEGVVYGKDSKIYAYDLEEERAVFVSVEDGAQWEYPHMVLKAVSGYEDGICLLTSDGLLVCNPDTGETEERFFWDDEYVKIDVDRITRTFWGQENLYLLSESETDSSLTRYRIGYEERKERQVITLGTFAYQETIDLWLEPLVDQYNRQSTDYRVEIISYLEEGGIYEMASELEVLFLRGEAPDLVDTAAWFSIDGLVNSNVFEDLTSYYKNSKVVKEKDILDNIWDQNFRSGQNVIVSPMFFIYTYVSSLEMGAEDWTIEKMLELAQTQDIAMNIRESGQLLSMGLSSNFSNHYDHFIDWESLECHFDTEEFVDFMVECSQIEPSNEDYNSSLSDLAEGKYLMDSVYLTGMADYVSEAKYIEQYGLTVSWVGYPGWDGGYSALYYPVQIAMSSSSENKAGAWDFLEYILSEECQDSLEYFPVRKDSFETHLQSGYKNEAYAERYNAIESVVGNGATEFYIPTEEELAQVRRLASAEVYMLSSANGIYSSIRDIISEEYSMYTAREATAWETAEKIQSRATLILKEEE